METTEAINEGCKFVAQARELLMRVAIVSEEQGYEFAYINDARILLDLALEKLAV